ncbi:MAG: histidine phosphatase family protein [Actinobacteria bacterium]|uniref:phosphoglycerate mutase (2,3-diphosphoglycerate-dependent) n=1 Tax=freshwater metagenome TaxID=449393 RepID=A0A6J5ZTK9_9ZZZZ|nr:histidine phosphatase family protein [Actinomycetota bacterium]
MPSNETSVVLLRHGETEWSLDGRHTGLSDIDLTENGRAEARAAGGRLAGFEFDHVLTSPLRRARETCELAGYGAGATTTDELTEWNYGEYEGIKTVDIHKTAPDWWLFSDGCPGGESAADVGARVDPLIERAKAEGGRWLFVAHGHVLRVVGARWAGLAPEEASTLLLGTAAICVLGWEHGRPALKHWNDTGSLR